MNIFFLLQFSAWNDEKSIGKERASAIENNVETTATRQLLHICIKLPDQNASRSRVSRKLPGDHISEAM